MVALRKESVDRNCLGAKAEKTQYVALRKESVDRNFVPFSVIRPAIESLSARRAWIEIVMQESAHQRKQVALRTESVDRNSH